MLEFIPTSHDSRFSFLPPEKYLFNFLSFPRFSENLESSQHRHAVTLSLAIYNLSLLYMYYMVLSQS